MSRFISIYFLLIIHILLGVEEQ